MIKLSKTIIAILLACGTITAIPSAHAAKLITPQAEKKQRLVLMPLRVPEEDRNLLGAMEAALEKGLQLKYEVFSGDRVHQKSKEIFNKETKRANTANEDCDGTRCMQDIAVAFQAELIAVANVTKRDGGYFIAISIRNVFDNKVVFSESLPCEGCNAFKVVEKLKELVGIPAQANLAPGPTVEEPKARANAPESALWGEVQKGNTEEDYQAYLSQYPKGKFIALAKTRLARLKQEAQAATAEQDKQAWEAARQSNSADSYADYLNTYPQGQYAALAQGRVSKLKKDQAAEEAKQKHEAALAAAPRAGQVFKDCPDCPEMVVIPAGSFNMGSNENYNEKPIHRVTFNKAYALGKTEITKGQFATFVNASNYAADNECWVFEFTSGFFGSYKKRSGTNWRNPGYSQDDNHPVTCINWNDAKAYTSWLSRKSGKTYQLPTEAQWEYACRAGGTHTYCGSDNVDSIAWYFSWDGDSPRTPKAVAQKQANAFGLHDMSGNVSEWIEDSYRSDYNGAPTDGSKWKVDPAVINKDWRVQRGGTWTALAEHMRPAFRGSERLDIRGNSFGFRVARTLP